MAVRVSDTGGAGWGGGGAGRRTDSKLTVNTGDQVLLLLLRVSKLLQTRWTDRQKTDLQEHSFTPPPDPQAETLTTNAI